MTLHGYQFGRWSYAAGALSYFLYLTHTSIGMQLVEAGKPHADGFAAQIVLMLTALAASVAFAVVFSRLIERPAMRASRQIALETSSR